MADAELRSSYQEQLEEQYTSPDVFREQLDTSPSATDLDLSGPERIFNLTGTAKLSSEHIARLQGSPSQDQIGAWPPSNTSSSQSLHGKFAPPPGGWVHYDKHMNAKKPLPSITKPGRLETDTIRRLNAERDAIRAAQADREASRKAAEEQAAAAKAEEEVKAKRADIEQRRQARTAGITKRQQQFQEVDQNYKQYLAGRKEPLYRTFEENFRAAQRERERAKVQAYNESLRPPKLRTVHSIITGAPTHAPAKQAAGNSMGASSRAGRGRTTASQGQATRRAGAGATARSAGAGRSSRGSASADGSSQGAELARKPVMVDRACSPFVFSTSDDAGAEQPPGAEPTRADDTSEVLDLEQTAAAGGDAPDSARQQQQSGSTRRSSSSLQALKDRRTSSLRRIQTTTSYRGPGGTAFTAGSDAPAFGSSEAAVQDPAAKVSARLARLNFTRQFSADERDDQHALSLTDPLSEAAVDDEVPDTYFVEREDSAQPLTPEGGLTASLGHMDTYDPDPPLDFDATGHSSTVVTADWEGADQAAQEQEDDRLSVDLAASEADASAQQLEHIQEASQLEQQSDGDMHEETDQSGEWDQAEPTHEELGHDESEQPYEQTEDGMADEEGMQYSASHAGAEEQSQASSEGLLPEEEDSDSVDQTEPYTDAAFDGPEVAEALPVELQQGGSEQELDAQEIGEQADVVEAAAAADDAQLAHSGRVQDDDVMSSSGTADADAVVEAESPPAVEASQEISLHEQAGAASEVDEATPADYTAQPDAEHLAAEAVNQDNELIGYVFDKAAQDGLMADSQPEEEGVAPEAGSDAEPEIEATGASMPAEPTGMTTFDSMYDEESTLSADGGDDYAPASSSMPRAPSSVPSLNLSTITETQASADQD